MANSLDPKETRTTLALVPNTLAVQNGSNFDYYAIKLGGVVNGYLQILKMPPIIAEGYITHNRKLYKLTYRDFFRRRLNVTQPSYSPTSAITNSNANISTPGDSSSTVGAMVEASVNNIQSGPVESVELQLIEIANMAWKEQVGTLLHSIDPEEEWFSSDYS